jgi:hypothetical protein
MKFICKKILIKNPIVYKSSRQLLVLFLYTKMLFTIKLNMYIFIYSMISKLVSRLFKKKLFRCEVIILKDDFIAEFQTDSLGSALDWVLHGIYEARYTSNYDGTNLGGQLSITKGIYGRIMPYKLLSISEKGVTLFGYKKPKPDEHVFMTDNVVHVPEIILKQVKKETLNNYFSSK